MTVDEIGAVVRQARIALGLRQDQLAAAAGVGLRFLVELERGKPTVRFDKVLAVLRALGLRLDIIAQPALRGTDDGRALGAAGSRGVLSPTAGTLHG